MGFMDWATTALNGILPKDKKLTMSKLQEYYNEAANMAKGVNPQNAGDAINILSKKGIDSDFISSTIDKIKPLAKVAKFAGVKQLKNVDIDNMADNAKQALSGKKTSSQPQYSSYDRRNSPIYAEQYQSKAKNFPK